jgi:MFS family permease
MLEDPKMYDIHTDEIGTVTSDLTIYSIPFQMMTTFFVSYLFELWGRKKTLFFSYLLTAFVYFLFPYSAPNFYMLVFLRCMIGVTMAAPISHPLIADYVKRKSRGKAIALAGVGIVTGEVFSMGVLFNLTKSMDYFDAFAIASSLILGFAFFFLLAIKDVNLDEIREKVRKSPMISPLKQQRNRAISLDGYRINEVPAYPSNTLSKNFKE